MKKLNNFEKVSVNGQGGTPTTKRKYAQRTTAKRKYKTSNKNSNSLFKRFDSMSHNLGLVAMTMISSGSTVFDSFINVLNEKEQHRKPSNKGGMYSEEYGYGSYYSDNPKKTYFSASQSIRPTLRFGAYAHRNSMIFGLPWA